MASVGQVLARIDALGGRLRVVGGALEFDGPLSGLTDDLRTAIRSHKSALVEAIRSNRITVLVCRLAEFGAWPTIFDGRICVDMHEGTPESVIPRPLLEEACARADELGVFCGKSLDELTDQELADLDYRRTLSDADLDWIDKAVWGTRSGGAAP